MTTQARKSTAPAQRAAQEQPKPALVLEFTATKETAGTVRYDMTEESAKANGGRGTNIYIPKSAINTVDGGLAPTIRIEIFKVS